jgi:hypothetical protein
MKLSWVKGYRCIKGRGKYFVKSSDGKREYEVNLYLSATLEDTCTCPAYLFHSKGTCKHIQRMLEENACGWDSIHFAGQPVDGKCPRCGSELEVTEFAMS